MTLLASLQLMPLIPMAAVNAPFQSTDLVVMTEIGAPRLHAWGLAQEKLSSPTDGPYRQ